ncbi:magnesium transporter ALR2 [Gaeumannomyces tritici R3-111a-1]|uniref:Magnesium transporter ALR2 n=1 Tax=Gaeumannomyces tritici (strain R3-111a-1) TaxID=644352 RepID=J3NKE1_GAET3|nr:magnesium transporter ALR2 [Gaeumannomyces tritici R3-111a-1]EJT81745.1 magnesium transporter ALR2 [Gaeumannomyces tritici R3-111a-1]
MSDHEDTTLNSGYSTPVPELDDHRHQSATTHRSDRPRRGTFDSLYGARNLELDTSQATTTISPVIRVRDFEEAVVDEDGADVSPTAHRTRRPTVTSDRSVSPPNSVKAFAEARRRERGMSISESRQAERRDENELLRTVSSASRQSLRSRPHTAAEADETASLKTTKSAEEDVCFPVQDDHAGDRLHIDFDFLESFIAAEDEAQAQAAAELRPSLKIFTDLRPSSVVAASPMVTSGGDFVGIPTSTDEKEEVTEDVKEPVKPAAPANRFNFFSSAWESTIHAPYFGDLVLPGEDIRGLFTFPKGETDGVWWLNVSNPTDEEVRGICRAFGIHPLTVEDITTQETREKIELFPSYYFACFRSFNVVQDEHGDTEFEPFYIYVIVFREGTLSFSSQTNSHASRVSRRISALKDYVALSSDWICYALIDDIVDCFAPIIRRLEHDTELIEDEVFIARTDDMQIFLRKIGIIRKNTMALMRLLGGKADVLKGFTKRCNENYKVTPRMDIGLYLGDIQDHVVTMMTNLGHFEKMLSRSHSNYLAQLSIDSITQGTRTNNTLTKITFLASIIVPLNVVTGLFGMNVHVPFQELSESLTPFFCILGGLLFFSATCLFTARRLRYI